VAVVASFFSSSLSSFEIVELATLKLTFASVVLPSKTGHLI